MKQTIKTAPPEAIDSKAAAKRLLIAVLLMTLGTSSMYAVAVFLPAVQAEFQVSRSAVSLPYTYMMLGLGLGSILMGKLTDRFGVSNALLLGAVCVGMGYVSSGFAPNIIWFGIFHGLLLGFFGASATFAPLMSDTSMWWSKYRGIAVGVCSSGNYLAGTIWPPIVQYGIDHIGWRNTYIAMGIVCGTGMFLLALLLRIRPPLAPAANISVNTTLNRERPFNLSLNFAQTLLCIAGVGCCVAMSMPQVHIVAYCNDLGFNAARGAEMLSLMLACGVASRLISGVICDRIGGLKTLLLGSVLQGIALLLFLPFDSLISLYIIAALFGLFQGGIIPAYAIIVREYFPIHELSKRVGLCIMATMIGMALGGWLSGKVFDLTGSYHASFINGILWNLLNIVIVSSLLYRANKANTSKLLQPNPA
jgi:MFS family permease